VATSSRHEAAEEDHVHSSDRRPVGTPISSLLLVVMVVAGLIGLVPGTAEAAAGGVTVLGAATTNLGPSGGFVAGPDGHLWFGNASGLLGELDPATNGITLHQITGVTNSISDVTVGGDGNIWFATSVNPGIGKVGRYNPNTDAQALFNSPATTGACRLTTGPDGRVWVQGCANNVAKINYDGSPAGIATANIGSAGDVELGPDGFLWVSYAGALKRIDPANGAITTFNAPPDAGVPIDGRLLTAGNAGDLWFPYSGGAAGKGGIARYVIATNTFTYFAHPTFDNVFGVAQGPDGNLWFTTDDGNAVIRMTPTGSRQAFGGFDVDFGGYEVESGPDGDLWSGAPNRILRIDAGSAVDPACLPPAFTDVSTSHPFFADICWMDQEGISTGYQPGPTYKPSAAVSRQAMSAFMYRLYGSPAFIPPAAQDATFGDVDTSNPFYLEIEWMAFSGITTGTPASPKPLYKPSAPVSRGAMSAFMYRLVESPPFTPPAPNATTFGDVNANHPFYLEIEWMADEEITTGTAASPKPLYKPAANVSRGAMSAFMHRLEPLL
jgi:streptogramin lyase